MNPASVEWTHERFKPLVPGTLIGFLNGEGQVEDLSLVVSAYYKYHSGYHVLTLWHDVMDQDGKISEWQNAWLKIAVRVLRVAENVDELMDGLYLRKHILCQKHGIVQDDLEQRL